MAVLVLALLLLLALTAHAMWLDEHGRHRPHAVDRHRRIDLRP